MLNLSKETIYGYLLIWDFPGGSVVKNQARRHRFDPWAGKMSWRRKSQRTLVFFPGKSHRQRSLEGYSPWGHKRVSHDLATNNNNIFINSLSV